MTIQGKRKASLLAGTAMSTLVATLTLATPAAADCVVSADLLTITCSGLSASYIDTYANDIDVTVDNTTVIDDIILNPMGTAGAISAVNEGEIADTLAFYGDPGNTANTLDLVNRGSINSLDVIDLGGAATVVNIDTIIGDVAIDVSPLLASSSYTSRVTDYYDYDYYYYPYYTPLFLGSDLTEDTTDTTVNEGGIAEFNNDGLIDAADGSFVMDVAGSAVLNNDGDVSVAMVFVEGITSSSDSSSNKVTSSNANSVVTGTTETTSDVVSQTGGMASIVNNGTMVVPGPVNANQPVPAPYDQFGTVVTAGTASVENNGSWTGDIFVQARLVTSTTDADYVNGVPVNTVMTTTHAGGTATVTNTGDINGDVVAVGFAASSVTNTGMMAGDVVAGDVVGWLGLMDSVDVNGAVTETLPVDADLQVSLINNSGTILGDALAYGGASATVINSGVIGGTITVSTWASTNLIENTGVIDGDLRVELGETTINNSGAIGGSILAATDAGGGFLTDTTVNWMLSDDDVMWGRITGVNTVNLDGSGVLVLDAFTADPVATHTIGTVNILGGTLQLGMSAAPAGSVLMIAGDVIVGPDGGLSGDGTIAGDLLSNGMLMPGYLSDTGLLLPGVLTVTGNVTHTGALLQGTPASNIADSLIWAGGDARFSGDLIVVIDPLTLFAGTQSSDFAVSGGTMDVSGLTITPTIESPFIEFTTSTRVAGGMTYATYNVSRLSFTTQTDGTPNQNQVARGLDAAIDAAADILAGGGSAVEIALAEDMAQVIATMSFAQTSPAETQALLGEMSGEFYASMNALNPAEIFSRALADNFVLGRPFAPERDRTAGDGMAWNFWVVPTITKQTFKGGDHGVANMEATTKGITSGAGLSVIPGMEVGLALGYADMDVEAKGRSEGGAVKAKHAGVYATGQSGPIGYSIDIGYNWNDYSAVRSLTQLQRESQSKYDGKQWIFQGHLKYDFELNEGATIVTPLVHLAYRERKIEGFTETGAGAVSLDVAKTKANLYSGRVGAAVRHYWSIADHPVVPFATIDYAFSSGSKGEIAAKFQVGDREMTQRGVTRSDYVSVRAGVAFPVLGDLKVVVGYNGTFGSSHDMSSFGVTIRNEW